VKLRIIGRDGVARVVAETCGECGELVRVGEPHSHRRVPPAPRKCRVTIVGMTSDAWDDLLRTYLDALAEAVATRPPVVYDVNHVRDQEPQADADRLPATG
jgi:hypothetical protein